MSIIEKSCHCHHNKSRNNVFTPFLNGFISFPLYSGTGLGSEVIEHAVDVFDLCGNALGDVLEQFKRHVFDRGCHGVGRVDGADDDRIGECALAVLHADRPEIRYSGKVLPHFSLQTVLCKLLPENRVGFAYRFETVAGDGSEAAHAESGTRERLTVNHAVRQTEGMADNADFVLEEKLHGFDQLKIILLRQAAHIVVRLHAVLRFEDVGVDRSLTEEADAFELRRFFRENVDEFLADDLALGLGIGYARQLVEEAVGRVDVDEVRAELIPEDFDDLLALALAHETVVDVNAGELLPHRLDEERRDDGRIDAAGEGKENLLIADLLPQFGDLFADKRFRERGRGDALHGFGTNVAGHRMPPNDMDEIGFALL